MIFVTLLLILIVVAESSISASSLLSLYLHEPRNDQVLTLDSDSTYLNLELRYQILGNYDINNSMNVCFEILATSTKYINLTCLKYDETSRISIEKLIPNNYTINLYIKNNDGILDHTRITSSFIVNTFISSLPRIKVSSETLVYALDEDIQITYSLSTSYIPVNNLNICLRLISEDGNYLMEYYCMSTDHTFFSLKNIESVGTYKVVLILSDGGNGNEYYEETMVMVSLVIKSLRELIPNIKLNEKFESVVNKNLLVPFEIDSSSMNVIGRFLELCVALRLVDDTNPKYIINECSTSFKSPLTISNLNEGKFMITLSFRNLQSMILYEPVASVVNVYKQSEFMPTYDWKTVQGFETVPSGLEIVLPLDGSSRRLARIPSPWKLQLALPAPCKYFVRMDIFKETHIYEIITEAEKTCKLKDCLILISDDKVIDPGLDALSSNLFNINKFLMFNESCQKHHL